MKKKEYEYAVSACLCGFPCRYDGKSKPDERVKALYESGKALSRRESNPICRETDISRTLLCFQPCHTSVCRRLQATQCTQNIRFPVLRSFKRINFCRGKKESGEMLAHFEHFCRRIGEKLSLKTMLGSTLVCLPVCPEMLGGLKTPRTPCEIVDGKILSSDGENRTQAYRLGSQRVLALCREHSVKKAILKQNSPSCGTTHIYDGTFSGKLIPGMGMTARLLSENGIEVTGEK